MARTRRPAPVVPENSGLVASAVNMPPVQRNMTGKTQQWQGQAWDYYDRIGELRFVSNWVGNVMSRARLVVAKDVDGVLVAQTDGPAVEALAAYFGGWQGQSQMLQQTGVHLTIPGEMYHVVVNESEWHCLAHDKVRGTSQTLTADLGDGKRTTIGNKDMAIRVWTPHPRDPLMADSPVRSNLGTLSEIATLNAHVQAQLESRLAGAGILMLPSEMTFPVPKEADPASTQADLFMATLAEAMMTPIKDRDSASAIVPIVVTAPGEFLAAARHLTFWTELDDKTIEMRDNAVKRLALGLDTPPEVLLGMADSNHWNAWLVDEAAVKSHLEPRLAVVAHAVTTAYLRPSLKGVVKDPENFYVVADTSEIRLRPNRSKEAVELYDRGELGATAVLRETGFKPEDAMKPEERREWMLRKIATGSTSPEQTQAALRILGADLGIPLMTDQGGQREITPVLDNKRTLEGHPVQAIPDRAEREKDRALPSRQGEAASARTATLAAADVLVYRALERTGNRLCDARARAEGLGEVPAQWRYMHVDAVPDNVLEGAWGFAAEVLHETGSMTDTARICAALDGYVRFIIGDKRKHHRDLLEAALIAAGVIEP
jgi:hypothetical protein